MSNIGYIYVLVNKDLDGVVKLGVTTGLPDEVAVEVSQNMGFPSPFTVGYDELFSDTEKSGKFVCDYLERKGYVATFDQEFVCVPVTQVAEAISKAPGALNKDHYDSGAVLSCSWSRVVDSGDSPRIYPWTGTYKGALKHYYKDKSVAYRLFSQAASLGCPAAYRFLACMTRAGDGVTADEAKGLELLEEGARKGSVVCYFSMASLLAKQGQREDAEKSASIFVKKFSYDLVDDVFITRDDVNEVHLECACLLYDKLHKGIDLPLSLRRFIIENVEHVRNHAESMAASTRMLDDDSERSEELRWVQVVLFVDAFSKDQAVLAA